MTKQEEQQLESQAIDDKATVEHDEAIKDVSPSPAGDYTGFVRKTDPAEIKLVRKLDRRIMVRQL